MKYNVETFNLTSFHRLNTCNLLIGLAYIYVYMCVCVCTLCKGSIQVTP